MPQQEIKIRAVDRNTPWRQFTGWFSSLFANSRKIFMINLGTREVLPEMNQEKAITEGFNANTAFYVTIRDDAEKFASIPRYVYDAKSLDQKASRRLPSHLKAVAGGGKKISNDLSKLLNRPNPYQGQAAFLKTVRAYYKTCGEAFIWLNRGDTDDEEGRPLPDSRQDLMPVLEMYPLPSNHVTVVPDPDNLWGVLEYILEVGGQKLPLRKNDVIHWKDINLKWDATTREHLRGMPSAKPGAATLQQNNDATLAATRMYQNDGAKGVLFGEETKGITATQESQIRTVVDRKVNNNDVKGAVATIMGAGKLGFLDLGGTSVDMELLKGKQMSWQEICALTGVPYEMYNTETTFANKEQAQKNWVSNKIMPACKELDDELNRQLINAFSLTGKAVIASDASELPEMQANMKELAEWLEKAWWITPNDKLATMGYEKGPAEFDEPWVPSNVQPLSSLEEPFDDLANEIGLNDYRDTGQQTEQAPAKRNGTTVTV